MTHPRSPQSDSPAYLTVILWPDGAERDAVVDAMATAARLDAPTLRLKARQHAPVILGRFDPETAQRAAAALIDAGGAAFAPTADDLVQLGPTLKIKDLRLEGDRLAAELWRGPSVRLQPDVIVALIRADLRESKVEFMPQPNVDYIGQGMTSRTYSRRHGLGGAYGLAAYYAMDYADDMSSSRASKSISTSSKLDLHTHDGRVFQIDGDKFGFQILGDQRGQGDKVNIDRLCDLFVRLAPDAVVDPYFSLWNPPTGHDRLRIPQSQLNKDDPAFAFYSRWASLMYRHIRAGQKD